MNNDNNIIGIPMKQTFGYYSPSYQVTLNTHNKFHKAMIYYTDWGISKEKAYQMCVNIYGELEPLIWTDEEDYKKQSIKLKEDMLR